jgi:hypothetical protein
MACCRCIPGAPGWPPPSLDAPPPPSTVAAPEEPAASGEAEAEAAGDIAADAEPEPAAEEDEGAIPIVDAVPVEQARPSPARGPAIQDGLPLLWCRGGFAGVRDRSRP